MSAHPTDQEILTAVADWGNSNATYVVKNKLRHTYPAIKSPWVLRQLKRLEKQLLIERKPTSYVTMHAWGVTSAGRELLKSPTPHTEVKP